MATNKPAFAVIFSATLRQTDDQYLQMAERLRELALSEFGCLEFKSISEGNQEIAISYWPSEQHILAWKQHPLHKQAQKIGQQKWYADYRVQVVKVEREYRSPEE
ncbi:antibiotic biosynthesis monooxygenase family protein [Thalassotalea mangrovi]|uniref:Antibiotic biosynthesis monooxygenase n=1 Tax=Thalassotalea mangrovi TaxID=2572245 RepID=A0A4U1B3C6_9GAMM|nr:antibiotic biosynthesis monooxygenase [Thalassotalea mangrovi]TKB44333.1 antibiotic biosynthesis monooxygenase [Thalassotalea mangrovi]